MLVLACARPHTPEPEPEAPAVEQEVAPTLPLGARAAHILSRAIQLGSVNPPGDERPCAAYFTELLREAGLEAALVPTPSGTAPQGRAAAWGVLRGSGGARPIVLLSHLDVVPANAESWEHDPFAGVVADGAVHGRGALDAKGVSVVHLLALTELARRGQSLRRDVIFLATPDEESGGRNGAGHLVRERPDLLRGAEYLLTEGGGVTRIGSGRPPIWGIAVTEKTPCWMRLVSRGRAGHSSVPSPDGAVARLIDALAKLRALERPVRVDPAVARMFASLAPVAAPEDAAGFADLETHLVEDEAFRERFLAQPHYAALVQPTLAITVLEGASRTNVMPATAVAHLDARLLPGDDCDDFSARVREAVADDNVGVEPLLAFPSRSSPVDTELYRSIERVARRNDGNALVVPRVVAGFTDAHYFRELGIVAYGFTPRWLRPDESRTVHGPNERISIENLERGVETLIEILEELDR